MASNKIVEEKIRPKKNSSPSMEAEQKFDGIKKNKQERVTETEGNIYIYTFL